MTSNTEALTPAMASTTYAASTRHGNITVKAQQHPHDKQGRTDQEGTHAVSPEITGQSSIRQIRSELNPGACPAAAGSQAQRGGCGTPQCCWPAHFGHPTPSPNDHPAAVLLLHQAARGGQTTSLLLMLWWWWRLVLLLPVGLLGCQQGMRQGKPTCGAQCGAAHACLQISSTH
jgi:hypothetical protein